MTTTTTTIPMESFDGKVGKGQPPCLNSKEDLLILGELELRFRGFGIRFLGLRGLGFRV
jgi:hypothetical protein